MRYIIKLLLVVATIMGTLNSIILFFNISCLTQLKDSKTWWLQFLYYVLIFVSASIIYFLYNYILNYVNITSNNKKLCLKIKYGNLFKNSKAIKVIPIDDDLTVDVDGKVHKKSVHYQFMKNNCYNISELDTYRQVSERICRTADNRYYLLKVGIFDTNYQVRLDTYLDYFSMVYELCKFIDNHAKGEEVVLSNIGTNIRIGGDTLDKMERLTLLKTIIETYNFTQDVRITILLRFEWSNVNKYRLSEF